MMFIIIALIFFVIFQVNQKLDTKKFIEDTEPYLRFLMEDDYKFLLSIKYGDNYDLEKCFTARVRDGILMIAVLFFFFLSDMDFVKILICFIGGFLAFKMPYNQLKSYYKANLHKINLMLPYYLKSLEILIQHYTVPVALARSIETAPEIFRPGLRKMVAKIEAGDMTVDPYMDFAKEYPVRDSMRMMRLLYRLGLGSQENKQEQLMMFSRTVSSLQNKSREQKYKERLEKMENKTMVMLFCTGGGILFLLLASLMMMMSI
ncbi:MAG: hypothetical protein HFH08_01550 [Bacilli bacterium]|nr:hypothetical protein [Bacilli bacterium]